MDEKKVAFITCVSDKILYKRCLQYVENLEVPQGFTIEIKKIDGARGMPSAYNQAMEESEAKYKVYFHHDTFIYNRKLIQEIVTLFTKYPQIGLLGVAGGTRLPRSGIWFEDGLHSFGKAWEYRRGGVLLYPLGPLNRRKERIVRYFPVFPPYKPVMVVDGLIMMTQYDLSWRVDLYDSFFYYEGPQCLEFVKKGYIVAIPYQKQPWCMHWGPQVERTPEQHREMWVKIRANAEIFVREYSEFIGKNVKEILKDRDNQL